MINIISYENLKLWKQEKIEIVNQTIVYNENDCFSYHYNQNIRRSILFVAFESVLYLITIHKWVKQLEFGQQIIFCS